MEKSLLILRDIFKELETFPLSEHDRDYFRDHFPEVLFSALRDHLRGIDNPHLARAKNTQGVLWFSTMTGTFGIVLTNNAVGDPYAYISAVPGYDEKQDIEFIKQNGSKFLLRYAWDVVRHLEEGESPRVYNHELIEMMEKLLDEKDGPIVGDGFKNPWVKEARELIERAKR